MQKKRRIGDQFTSFVIDKCIKKNTVTYPDLGQDSNPITQNDAEMLVASGYFGDTCVTCAFHSGAQPLTSNQDRLAETRTDSHKSPRAAGH